MLYKFKSQATGELIMLGPHGDALLRALGREPAPRGIIEAAAMPAAIASIERAVAEDEAARAAAREAAAAERATRTAAGEAAGEDDEVVAGPGLRQRLWPMVEMLRRAMAADTPIVWGV